MAAQGQAEGYKFMSLDKNYAFILNGVVTNVVVFDNPSEELLSLFKEEHQIDDIVIANKLTGIGGTYDGVNFVPPATFPSWVWDTEKERWMPPVEHPIYDGKGYAWDETSLSWKEI
jgi:hypothetical protein